MHFFCFGLSNCNRLKCPRKSPPVGEGLRKFQLFGNFSWNLLLFFIQKFQSVTNLHFNRESSLRLLLFTKNARLLLDIWQLQAITLALVECLQPQAEQQRQDSQACEDKHRCGVVVRSTLYATGNLLGNTRVELLDSPSDKDWHTHQTEVLHPEDE